MGRNSSGGGDARYWTGVLYPENMRDNWQMQIGDILQYPYAYCIHTRDRDSKSEHRKDHLHLVVCFPNTTTYNNAFGTMQKLSAEGKQAINKCERVGNIRHIYDYLIHDTEDCKKQGKEPYSPSERIEGNGFDIGLYEQISAADKKAMTFELYAAIKNDGYTNLMDFLECAELMGDSYLEIAVEKTATFERMTRANFQKWQVLQEYGKEDVRYSKKNSVTRVRVDEQHENNTPKCCPECGSVNIRKSGKTAALSQRWQCKDCGKTFIQAHCFWVDYDPKTM